MKAKYLGKYYGSGYNKNFVYLEYEYRGMTYTVYQNRAKGNEPIAWQHKTEQARIDSILDAPKQTKGKPVDIDEIFEILGWD